MPARWLLALGMAFLPTAAPAQPEMAPRVIAPSHIIAGDPTTLTISDVAPGERIRIHAFRRTTVSITQDGRRVERPVTTHAWADYRADASGSVALDTAPPLAGTYTGSDPNGLLWSGWPIGDARLGEARRAELDADAAAEPGQLVLRVERNGRLGDPVTVRIRGFSDRVRFTELEVARDGVSGVFAAPEGASRLPTLILLHGSEGGSMAAARAWSGRMAERGFAALALNYVAYAWTGGISGVPTTFTNLPVELLGKARTWIASRAEAHSGWIALVGGSKGAELALVGASRYAWVTATVACVPSDVVWAGYGRQPAPGELLSSWSFQGRPLPFIPYDRYEEVFNGRATAAQVHVRSRTAAPPAVVAASRIPVGQIAGPVLLLGAGRDEVWPSLAMSRNIRAAYRRSGRSKLLEVGEYSEAGHNICGTGAIPARADGRDGGSTARATGAAFRKTLNFLEARLKAAP